MLHQTEITNFDNLITKNNKIYLVVGADASVDEVSIAASMYKALKKIGKRVSLLSPGSSLRTKFSQIIGLEKLKDNIGEKNLIISFDYDEEAIDKVSYHISDDKKKFYLTISPQDDANPLDHKTVEFDYAGADAQVIITVGVKKLDELEQLYLGYENFYKDATKISINKFKPSYADLSIDLSQASCMSEQFVEFLEKTQLPITSDIATNILYSIKKSTNNFESARVTADTYKIASKLMKYGAKRKK